MTQLTALEALCDSLTMAKTKYKIETKFGTITRSSDRVYTHVVVGGKMTEAALRKSLAWSADRIQDQANDRLTLITNGVEKLTDFDLRCCDCKDHEEAKVKLKAQILERHKQVTELRDPKTVDKCMATRRPAGLMGFAGSLQLARKLTTGWKAEELEEVLIYDVQTGKVVV